MSGFEGLSERAGGCIEKHEVEIRQPTELIEDLDDDVFRSAEARNAYGQTPCDLDRPPQGRDEDA